MALNFQLITSNNEHNLKQTLDSIKHFKYPVFIADLGSTDGTVSLAKSMGANVVSSDLKDRSVIRNKMRSLANSDWVMVLEPGEIFLQGKNIISNKFPICYVQIMESGSLRKEIRLLRKDAKCQFKYPIYEVIDSKEGKVIDIYIQGINNKIDLQVIADWKQNEPMNAVPIYYEAQNALVTGEIDEFLRLSQHFMFYDKNKTSISSVMNRYYNALVNLHKANVKPIFEHINFCLCQNPLMAEFWCLMGDTYYHLYKDFVKAKKFYENAIIIGNRRFKNDLWPMEIAKYKEYPNLMIKSCQDIEDSKFHYVKSDNA